jgi:hypothetical protein
MFWDKPVVEIKEVVKYRIVEVPKERTTLQGGKEIAEQIQTLASHPGFLALLNKLEYANYSLSTKLKHERLETIEQYYFLQAGIYWSNWLKTEMQRATVKLAPAVSDAMQEEMAAFREIDATIERVGQ